MAEKHGGEDTVGALALGRDAHGVAYVWGGWVRRNADQLKEYSCNRAARATTPDRSPLRDQVGHIECIACLTAWSF